MRFWSNLSSSTMLQPFHFCLFLFFIIIINSLFPSNGAQALLALPSANVSTKWINNGNSIPEGKTFDNGVKARYILVRNTSDFEHPEFGCGFICPVGSVSAVSCDSFLFSIFIGNLRPFSDFFYVFDYPQIVWSANRDRPVRENATLEFSQNGELVLRDFDGTTVWSTNTLGKYVVGMELNKVGSLVLFDKKMNTVWSSMDYPTDSLVLGQTLRQGQRLTANVSVTNSSQGPLYLSVVKDGIEAFVGSQIYYRQYIDGYGQKNSTFISFNNGSFDLLDGSVSWSVPLPVATSVQYMRLDYEGHLRLYELKDYKWVLLGDVLEVSNDDCGYPTVCGEYGICTNGQCTCPDWRYFTSINHLNPKSGCMPLNAISCKSLKTQQFLFLRDTSYFTFLPMLFHPKGDYVMRNSTEETCKQACLVNCSCTAVIFMYGTYASIGDCYFPTKLYSLKNILPSNTGYNSSVFIKVQSFPNTNSTVSPVNTNVSKGKKLRIGIIVAASVGALLACFLIALVMRRCSNREDADDDEFTMVTGLPTKFAFEDIRVATNDFLRKLGEGGFGSVFEGTLVDGTKIAVKRLDSVGQGKKEFLAEVETIGRIHHLHLVRLVGFCAEKSYRLLIYEYMLNGSLDKWIFYKNHDTVLDWQTRRNIITDIAKGLTYLHEECRQKIVHLDIKPQNILLDENFNAKVSDFGLAKLIDRDQVEVMTRMRGTPGYLAPEWLTSVITEKVDVFSFGVVVLEIICGRRNIDNSKDEESFHLISLLQRKVVENKLVDMVDCRCIDMQIHINDVIVIMHLAMWCLQSDSNKRPLMSVVLKVLDGSLDVEANLDYNFTNPTLYVCENANIVESAQPTPSILSGPR